LASHRVRHGAPSRRPDASEVAGRNKQAAGLVASHEAHEVFGNLRLADLSVANPNS
jgi:hypothetical protein